MLSIVGKVFSRISLNRLIDAIINNILPESPCGFWANRGTVEMIFSARQQQEKCREQNLPLYYCLTDLSKAFDTVNRSTLWRIKLKLGYPEKFVSLIRSLHVGMKARFGFSGALSDEIPVNNGVKQGDISASTPFTIYFAVVFLVTFNENPVGIYIIY